jgi:hypothetical protein
MCGIMDVDDLNARAGGRQIGPVAGNSDAANARRSIRAKQRWACGALDIEYFQAIVGISICETLFSLQGYHYYHTIVYCKR